jgi:predicted RNA methylase
MWFSYFQIGGFPIMLQPKPHIATTDHEIKAILGAADEEIVLDILNTGATAGEVAEAFAWLGADDYMGVELQRKAGECVRRVYDILLTDRDSSDER